VELVPYKVRCSDPVTGPRVIRVAGQGVVKGVKRARMMALLVEFFGNSIKSNIMCGGENNQGGVLG